MNIIDSIKLIESLQNEILVEARHNTIFDESYNALVKQIEKTNFEIPAIKSTKNLADRIFSYDGFKKIPNTWKVFMAEVLIYELYHLTLEVIPKTDKDIEKFLLDKIKKMASKKYNVTDSAISVYQKLLHSNGIEYQKIKDLNPLELSTPFIEKLAELEIEYNDNKDLLSQLIEIDDSEILIDFGEYVWVDLKKPYCGIEGDAMGHCGNSGSYSATDTVLSLRKRVTHEGEKFYKPVLTFILKKGKVLGEMKGRANNKPSEKYHKYIVELLKSDYVDHISGGGYKPENNFSINDLSDQYKVEIAKVKGEDFLTEKSELFIIHKEYNDTGVFTPEMMQSLEDYLSEHTTYDFDITLSVYNKQLCIDLEPELSSINYLDIITSDEHLDIQIEDDSDYENYIGMLSDKLQEKVINFMLSEYKDEIASIAVEMGSEPNYYFVKENFNKLVDDSNIYEIQDAILHARINAYESGTEGEIFNEFTASLNSVYRTLEISNGLKLYDLIENHFYQPIIPSDFNNFIKSVIDEEAIDFERIFDEPRYGFFEFDEVYFKSSEGLEEKLRENGVIGD
jgi:hypothetical protein